MKKSIIIFSLLVSLVVSLLPNTALAQQSIDKNAIYIYRNDGDFNAFLNCDVNDITYSKIDLDGQRHNRVVVQEVHTPDSVYRIPVAAIDSVVFGAPKPVFKSDVFHLTAEHLPYVLELTESSVTFEASIPESLLPSEGLVVVSDIDDEPLDNGFAGRVINIDKQADVVRIDCESVELSDVYEMLVIVGKTIGYTDSESPSGAPRRIHVDSEGVLTYTISPIEYPFTSYEEGNESGHAKLTLSPSLEMNYAICYNVKGRENRFKCVVSPILDCDFDFNWQKTFHKEFKTDSIPIKIPTKVPLLFARVEIGAFLDVDGKVNLNAHQHMRVQSNIGYDSQDTQHHGFVFNFNGTKIDLPEGSVDLSATAHTGLSVKFLTYFVTENVASAYVKLKAGPRFGADINFKTSAGQPISWANLSDSHLSIEPLVTKLSAGVTTLFTGDDNLPEQEWSVFGKKDYYLFPTISKPHLPVVGNAHGCSLTAVTTDISRNLLFPVTPGIKLYDSTNKLVKTEWAVTTYKTEEDWSQSDLQLQLKDKYAEGTYTAVPVFKLYNTTLTCDTSEATITVPKALTLDRNIVCMKKGNNKSFELHDGWGHYTCTNSSSSICSVSFVSSDGRITSTTWPPSTAGYENDVPSLKVTGKNYGTALLSVTDVRAQQQIPVKVIVNESGEFPVISADSIMNFGNIATGSTESQDLTVKGSDLASNLTVSYNGSSCFKVNTRSINKADAHSANGATITVTYQPTEATSHEGTITISGGGAESKTITLTGKGAEITVNNDYLWEPTTYEPGKELRQTFKVKGTNTTGKLRVRIESINGSAFSINNNVSELPASGGNLTVIFKPTEAGKPSARIHISGDNASEKVINLNGTCATITANPNPVNFDIIQNDNYSTQTVNIKGNYIDDNLTLETSGSYFSIDKSSITKSNANSTNGVDVTVTYHPTAAGDHTSSIIIKKKTDGTIIKTIGLTGKSAEITVSPSDSWECTSYGEILTNTFTVTGINTANMTVTQEDIVDANAFSYTGTLTATGGKLTVTFNPTDAGNYATRLHIQSGPIRKTINLAGTRASLSGVPNSHDFGTIEKGETQSFTFKLKGQYFSDNLTLAASGNYYSVSPTSINKDNLLSGVDVTVTYHPTAAGNHDGSITIKCGAATVKTIGLTGKSAEITVSPSDSWECTSYGEILTKTFTVTGINTTNMTVTQEDIVDANAFSYTGTLTATGGKLTVTFNPTDPGNYATRLHIQSGSIRKTINLAGSFVRPTPSVTVSPTTTLHYSCADTQSFKVTGTNLTHNLTLEIIGNGKQHFSLGSSTVTKTDATSGAWVSVTCSPKNNVQTALAYVNVLHNGTVLAQVTLSYAKKQVVQSGAVNPDGDMDTDKIDGGSNESSKATWGDFSNLDEMMANVKIYTEGQNIVIETPVGQEALISDIAGRAHTVSLHEGHNEIPVNSTGIYIVRVREKTVKLMLK